MPRAYGSDRVRELPDHLLTLECHDPKGWLGRTARSSARSSSEHPGTAIRWDDQLYEVIQVDSLPTGATRYTLRPWEDSQVVRTCESYDEQSEKGRRASRADLGRREHRRRLSILLSLLVGHLPSAVQQELHLEYGVSPALPTVISAIPFFVAGFLSLFSFILSAFMPVAVPAMLLLLGVYFFAESLIRLSIAFSTGAPVGSLLGALAYVLWAITTGRPIRRGKGLAATVAGITIDQQTAKRDAFLTRQPLLALLSAAEQRRFERAYGFDPIAWGKKTAWLILILAGLAVVIQIRDLSAGSVHGARLPALLINVYFVGEQIARLMSLSRSQPMGSVLGVLVRPLTRRL